MTTKKILGLDLGTNSIGSGLVELNESKETVQRIIFAGSRIIPMGEEKTAFEQGQKITKNEGRRLKRGARRINQRYKLRRNNLVKVFKAIGVVDDKFNPSKDSLDQTLLGKNLTDFEIYSLRAIALYEKVSLTEFARIIYHLNQRRGYQPNRKERAQKSQEENSNYTVSNHTARIASVTKTGEKKAGKDEYEVSLIDGTTGYTTNSSFASMPGTDKEFEIVVRKKTNKKGEVSITFGLPDPSDWQKKIEAMENELNISDLTPGEFYCKKIGEARHNGLDFRIRQNFVMRHRYKDEFNRIWDKQAEYHKELSDERVLEDVIDVVMPLKSPEKGSWRKKSLKEFIRDYIIFFQRPLKSQKNSIGFCRFEKRKRVMPVSHPLYQEFRIWQAINNLQLESDEEGKVEEISSEKKEKLFEFLNTTSQASKERVAKILDVYPEQLRMPENIPGNETLHELSKAIKKVGLTISGFSREKLELLWHILYSLEEIEDVEFALIQNFKFSDEEASVISNVYFDKDWGSLSARAIKRILPLMRDGRYFSHDDIVPEIKERIERVINGEEDDVVIGNFRERLSSRSTLTSFAGLQYWEAASLCYGNHTSVTDSDPYALPEEIKPVALHSLRNPVVEQVINETLHLVKDIWKTFGKPDEIRIELPREMKQNAEKRAKAYSANIQREKERKEVAQIIRNEFSIKNPSRKDIDRYLIWRDSQYYCIYSGQNIPKSALFNGETDIDHIIPRQRFFDDSFQNKVLVFRKANEEKGNKTAFEYMRQKDWERYEADVKRIFKGKRKFFLLTEEIPKDFVQRQLNDSRFIARKVTELLGRVCPGKVWVTSGTVTDYLKNQWGLNEVFKEVLKPRFERLELLANKKLISEERIDNKKVLRIEGYEKRVDHRHHALDAIVVAVTNQGHIQRLNNLNQIFEKGEVKDKSARNFKLPNPEFRDMVKEKLDQVIVSHKSRKRLVAKSLNVISKRDDTGQLTKVKQEKGTLSVRGALHDEQPYGLVRKYEKIKVEKAFEIIDKVAVSWQKELLANHFEECGGDLKKAIKTVKKAPLADLKGEKLEEVTVFIEKYIKTYELNKITEKQLNNIADRKLARDLTIHAEKYNKDFAKAFSDDGLVEFNSNRKKPVFKVRVMLNADLKALPGKRGLNSKRFIKEGSNYCFVVYEDAERKRTYDNISFFDAVQLAADGLPLVEKKTANLHFTLHAGELVYVPLPDQNYSEIDWTKTHEISKRVYKFVKSSGNEAYFLPHSVAQVLNRKNFIAEEFGSQNCTVFINEDNPRTKISDQCIKIHCDRLGKIKPLAAIR